MAIHVYIFAGHLDKNDEFYEQEINSKYYFFTMQTALLWKYFDLKLMNINKTNCWYSVEMDLEWIY